MKSMSGWKIPSPSSWSRRVISLVKEDRFENSASRRFPSQHSCSVRALLSPWERDAKDMPTWSTHFYRAFLLTMVFKPSIVQPAALSGWTCLNLAQDPLFSTFLSSCTDAFQRQTLILESRTGHSRVGPSQHSLVLLQAYLEKSERFT